MKPLTILNKYFNTDANGTKIDPIGDFKKEVDALSADEKRELASLAAPELGVELDAA